MENVEEIVAPLAGAWIEILQSPTIQVRLCVAPLAGAWIEISKGLPVTHFLNRRSPCGSVD